MNERSKRFATRAGILAAAVAATVAVPTTAQAASYNGKCGSGYGVIDSLTISGYGTVYLTYNGSSGMNCAVTIRDNPGTAMFMDAGIQLAGNRASEVHDPGQWTTYAGPVYLSAAGQCIDWGGQIGTVISQRFNVHCG